MNKEDTSIATIQRVNMEQEFDPFGSGEITFEDSQGKRSSRFFLEGVGEGCVKAVFVPLTSAELEDTSGHRLVDMIDGRLVLREPLPDKALEFEVFFSEVPKSVFSDMTCKIKLGSERLSSNPVSRHNNISFEKWQLDKNLPKRYY